MNLHNLKTQQGKRAIVFGGSGFIGSHVTEQLILAGHDVCVVVRSGSDTRFLQSISAKTQEIDFGCQQQITDVIVGHDIVYCCLANPKHHQSMEGLREVEVRLSAKILESAIAASAKRFMLLSTVMVYGFSRPARAIDESYPPKPTYTFNRVALEREETLKAIAGKNNIELVILRPSNTIGKRDFQMAQLFSSYRQGFFPIFGREEILFSGIDTRDIGRAMVFLAGLAEASNQTYLVKGFDTSWLKLKTTLDKINGKNPKIIKLPVALLKVFGFLCEKLLPYSSEPQLSRFSVAVMSTHTLFDTKKIADAGFTSHYSLEDALKDHLDDG